MSNEERWEVFIKELKVYIEEHHHCANKHTDLYNRTRYYRRKMKEGTLPEDKAKVLEYVLKMRHFDKYAGGRKRKSANIENK